MESVELMELQVELWSKGLVFHPGIKHLSHFKYFLLGTWVFPKIGGFTPKWMVKIRENPIKMDDLVGYHYFLETPIWIIIRYGVMSWFLYFLCCFFLSTCKICWFNMNQGVDGGHFSDLGPKVHSKLPVWLVTVDSPQKSHRHQRHDGSIMQKGVFNVVLPEKDDLYGFLVMIWSNTSAIHHPKCMCLNMFRAVSVYKDTTKDLVQSNFVRNSAMRVAICEASMMLGFEVALLANRAEARLRLQCLVTNFIGNRQTLTSLLGFDI